MAERGFIILLPQKLLDCIHHEEGFRENTEIRIQGKGFISHTVLHSNSAVLHDVNAYHVTNSALVVIFYIDFCQNPRFNSW